MVSKGLRSVQQVLVQWSDWPPSLSTWEELETIRQRFPFAPAWGQAASEEQGDVTTPAGPRRSSRPRKPNARIMSSEWEN